MKPSKTDQVVAASLKALFFLFAQLLTHAARCDAGTAKADIVEKISRLIVDDAIVLTERRS